MSKEDKVRTKSRVESHRMMHSGGKSRRMGEKRKQTIPGSGESGMQKPVINGAAGQKRSTGAIVRLCLLVKLGRNGFVPNDGSNWPGGTGRTAVEHE